MPQHVDRRGDGPGLLETLTVRLKRGGLVLPALSLLSLYMGGEAFHFRELYETPLVRGHFETGAYRLTAQGLDVRIEAEYRCRPEDLVLTPYTDPDGEPVFCHNTEIADCRVRLSRRRGLSFERTAELYAPKRGHFEYAGRAPDPAVTRRHVNI